MDKPTNPWAEYEKTKDLESKLARIEDGYNRAIRLSIAWIETLRTQFPEMDAVAESANVILKDFVREIGGEFNQDKEEMTIEDVIKREAQ